MTKPGSDNTEASVRDKLQKVLEQATIPTLPVVAQKLVEMCQEDRAGMAEFARVIKSDGGLASRLLRVANSAYYGLRHKATTVDRAIGALGLKQVKSISLGFQLASSLGQGTAATFDAKAFWEQSLLRGVIARELARTYCPRRADEAFIIGLLQDCGIPFLAQAWSEAYITMLNDFSGSHSSLPQLENELFQFNHMAAAEMIVQEWRLPEILCLPLYAHHHRPESAPSQKELTQLCQISYFVATVPLDAADLLTEDHLALPDYCLSTFGLDCRDLKTMLQAAQQQFHTVAQLFSTILPEKVDPLALLGRANMLLSQINEDTTFKLLDIQAELDRLRANCALLVDSIEELTVQSETDKLTSLATRGIFERHVAVACNRVRTGEASLTLLFMDIDNFRQINNDHSHAAGDHVLCETANLLRKYFDDSGFVSRYGGDEFVVSIMGLSLPQATALTEAFMARVEQEPLTLPGSQDGADLHVSCSVGLIFCEPGADPGDCAALLKLADEKMYQAKNTGKKKMCFHVIPTTVPTESPVDDSPHYEI